MRPSTASKFTMVSAIGWHLITHGGTILVQTGPTEWTTACPDYYEYICRVKWLGDYTWIEVDTNGESVLK